MASSSLWVTPHALRAASIAGGKRGSSHRIGVSSIATLCAPARARRQRMEASRRTDGARHTVRE